MFDKLKQRWGASAPSSTGKPAPLAERLAAYPPYRAPHLGRGKQLSVDQARENLAFFQASLAQRLDIVAALLKADAGIDIAPALAAPRESGVAMAAALNAWAGQRWPALHDPRLAYPDAWVNSPREGADIVLSLVLDVAVVLGELVRRANPVWRWDLDLSSGNLRDKMLSARRVVLLADPVGSASVPFVEDVEDQVATRLGQIDRDNERALRMDPWARLVDESQRGLQMAAFQPRG